MSQSVRWSTMTLALLVGVVSGGCSAPGGGGAEAPNAPSAVGAAAGRDTEPANAPAGDGKEGRPEPTQPPTAAPVGEVPLTVVPLAGPVTDPGAEISGLAWYQEQLVLLPQYPGWLDGHRQASGHVYAVTRASLESVVGGDTAPITPREVPFDASGVDERIPGFEGFEALALSGDTVYVAVEAQTDDDGMASFLVSGRVQGDLAGVTLDPETMVRVAIPAGLDNMSVEALVVTASDLLAVFEANGANVNPSPEAYRFGLDLAPLGTVAWPTLEYRVTDATAIDAEGRFWVSNFYWTGQEDVLRPADDALAQAYGEGPTHARSDTVERLVAFEYRDGGVSLVDTPPVQLQLLGDLLPRNWEGLVRLGDQGFLLATDTRPVTVLAFAPSPSARPTSPP